MLHIKDSSWPRLPPQVRPLNRTSSAARPWGVSPSRPEASRSTKPRTGIAVAVAPVTPACAHSSAREAEEQDRFLHGELGGDRRGTLLSVAQLGHLRSLMG
jgi:hypothetical protein